MKKTMLVFGVLLIAAWGTRAAMPAPEAGLYSHALLRPVDMRAVRWDGGFWGARHELCKNVIVPEMKKALLDPENSACLKNFRIGAGLEKGPHVGTNWSDGDCYKWIEAMAWLYAIEPDPALDKEMDTWIELIAKTQAPDGYISTQVQFVNKEDPRAPQGRWQNVNAHELYNMGHLMTAASAHYQATGKKNFLDVANKVAEYLYKTFSPRPVELAHMDFNPSQMMGLVDLYRVTGEKRWLELADIFVTMRGSQKVGPNATRNFQQVPGDQTQDRTPLRRETEAVGHAVTGGYLYCGAADVAAETGDKALQAALERIWQDWTGRKMYITGANGAIRQGVSIHNDPVHEAFGFAWELPMRIGYNETCANIAGAMFGWRMNLLTGKARYADLMELVFYNCMLSAMSQDGKNFCYCNPLKRTSRAPLEKHDTEERWRVFQCYCCPPSVARTLARMHVYAYAWNKDGLWVNLYGSNTLDQKVDGGRWRVTQKTDYPWDGTVRLRIGEAPAGEASLNFRIPAWAEGAKMSVNGQGAGAQFFAGSYARVSRAWKQGDAVELTLPMEARLMEANPLVEQVKNQAAVQRGPLVYCLESIDLPEGAKDGIDRVLLARDARLRTVREGDLLGGVTVLETEGLLRPKADAAGAGLYRPVAQGALEPIKFRMIPYYAWNNRGTTEMSVWLGLR